MYFEPVGIRFSKPSAKKKNVMQWHNGKNVIMKLSSLHEVQMLQFEHFNIIL